MKRIFLAGATRTAIGKFGGALRSLSAADLGVESVRGTLSRVGLTGDVVEETFFGCARQAGGGPNVARQIAYRSGVPVDRPATTINMACASSIQALIEAARAIKCGDRDITLVGGTEAMSAVPHFVMGARWGIPLGKSELVDAMYHDGFHCKLCDMVMGATADKLAQMGNISRQAQDEFALQSQLRAGRAQAAGAFAKEIIPFNLKSRKGDIVFDTDEHPRPTATLESLAQLPPVFGATGTVTAGNACGITDGASSFLLLSEEGLKRAGLTAEIEIVGYAQSGVAPDMMGLGPVPAVRALLGWHKMSLANIDLIELNEAFAGQVLACDSELHFDHEKLNVNGGAIALGHPIGATGARIITTLVYALTARDKEWGLATLCVSGGQGVAVLLRRVP